MRPITKQAINAFNQNRSFRLNNTAVSVEKSGYDSAGRPEMAVYLRLHGNIIASKFLETGKLVITTADWNTRTTRDRLNGLPGVKVWQAKGQLWLKTAEFPNGVKWDGFWIAVN